MNYVFKLVKVARGSGGDRYESEIGENRPWVIYVPQSISRASGKVADVLVADVREKE